MLRPWCRQAPLKELRKAEIEWFDIAGRADAQATLWTWAWERFPDIVHPDLAGVNETHEVIVECHDGNRHRGFPDNRASRRGQLTLVPADATHPFVPPVLNIDQIRAVIRLTEPAPS